MHVIYHPDAEVELLEAAQFYEGRVPGLGDRFLDDYETAIATILGAPERWRIIEGSVRRYLMPQFPYAIYYRVEGDVLRILVVKHHGRRPGYWRYRLGE
jgi:toxin ParE1/3/4